MYTYTWKKYLPIIRILLKRSPGKVIPVQLNSIDFDKERLKFPPSYAFTIDLLSGRIGNTESSKLAQELVEIVGEDEVCHQLTKSSNFKIDFSNSCQLSIEKITGQYGDV